MKYFVGMILCPFLLATSVEAAKAKPTKPKQSLYGLVLILDPGHGGNDPGSHGVFQGKPVYENEYAYDVVKRVELFAKERGAVVFKTLVDKKMDRHRNDPAWKIMPDNRDEIFAIDKKHAYAGSGGLSKRVAFANQIRKKYPRHKVVFLAIHFDIAGKNMQGAYSIIPNHGQRPKIAKYITETFRELNSKKAIKVAGEDVKNIYILGHRNQIREKVLIELGNFQSTQDQWRIRNFENRNRYALRIIAALEKFMRG